MTAAELVDILIKIPATKRKNYKVETLDHRDIEVTVDRDKQTVEVKVDVRRNYNESDKRINV